MKRIKTILLFMCLTVVLFFNAADKSFASTNNTTTINTGTTYTGITNSNNAYNYYKFTTTSDGYIDLNMSKNQNVKFRYALLDENFNSYETWTTQLGSGSETRRMGLPMGTYYIRIDKNGYYDTNTAYSLHVNETATSSWEKEFNNNSASANKISLNKTYYGITDVNNNYDYYKFTTTSNGYIDLKISKNQNVKFRYALLNENLNSFETWTTTYGSSTETRRMGLPKGTYYIRIDKNGYYDDNTQYSLRVDTTSTSSWENEFNDNSASANKISVNKTYYGITDVNNNYDYYRFTLTDKGYLDIKFKQNPNVKFRYTLLNEKLNSHGTWTTPYGSSTSSTRMGLPKGTYYIRIDKNGYYDTNTQYSFSVNPTYTSNWESEFNNTAQDANKISLGTTYNGLTDVNNNYDYYRFTLSSKSNVDVRFKRNSNVKYRYQILDEARNIKANLYSNSGSGYEVDTVNLPKGTYYLRVDKYGYYDDNTQYSFSIGKKINTFTVNSVNTTSTALSGKGLSGATVKAYVGSKQIGKSVTVASNGTYKITIPKQTYNKKITLKISKKDYITKEISTTVLKKFSTFTVNSIKTTSTSISGKGLKNATVKAYVGSKQIGKTIKVSSNGTYKITIPKQKKGSKVVVKMSNSGYETMQKTITVK